MENRHNNDVSPLTANDAITDDVRSYLSTKSFYSRHKKNHPPLKPIDLNIHHEDKSAEVRAESVEGISLTALPHDIMSESADNTIIEESTIKLQISRGNELTEEDHNASIQSDYNVCSVLHSSPDAARDSDISADISGISAILGIMTANQPQYLGESAPDDQDNFVSTVVTAAVNSVESTVDTSPVAANNEGNLDATDTAAVNNDESTNDTIPTVPDDQDNFVSTVVTAAVNSVESTVDTSPVAANNEGNLDATDTAAVNNDESTNDTIPTAAANNTSESRRGRKRQRDPENWQRNIRQKRRNEGLEYVSCRGKVVGARAVKDVDCGKCKFNCSANFSSEVRREIFSVFWGLGDHNRRTDFIANHCTRSETTRRQKQDQPSRRNYSISYYLTNNSQRLRVCKDFFLKTLDIGHDTVYVALNNNTQFGAVLSNERVHKIPGNKFSDETQRVIKHIGSFPTMESHYARSQTNKKFLDSSLNVRKMYELYVQQCNDDQIKPVSETYYRHIFKLSLPCLFTSRRKIFATFVTSLTTCHKQRKHKNKICTPNITKGSNASENLKKNRSKLQRLMAKFRL